MSSAKNRCSFTPATAVCANSRPVALLLRTPLLKAPTFTYCRVRCARFLVRLAAVTRMRSIAVDRAALPSSVTTRDKENGGR